MTLSYHDEEKIDQNCLSEQMWDLKGGDVPRGPVGVVPHRVQVQPDPCLKGVNVPFIPFFASWQFLLGVKGIVVWHIHINTV